VLSGDNAIVVGMAAASTPKEIRQKVIFWGIAGAVVLRVALALVTTRLLQVVGLTLAGGILLLWVCWKLYREILAAQRESLGAAAVAADREGAEGDSKSFGQAMWQIVLADISMSLDNVLAVAGAAREHPVILAFGLVLSVALMGAAASFIARLLDQHRWLAWVGLLIILYVALRMVWEGMAEVSEAVARPAARTLGRPPG
jgi:YjbE family integral membrane protein